jgi:hypothetical protein
MNTCFICLEDGEDGKDVHRVCACTTRVHLDCFCKLVQEVPTHRNSCPICQTKYAVRVRRKLLFCAEPHLVRSQCIGLVILFSLIASASYFSIVYKTSATIFTLVFTLLIALFLFFLFAKMLCTVLSVVETRTLVLP